MSTMEEVLLRQGVADARRTNAIRRLEALVQSGSVLLDNPEFVRLREEMTEATADLVLAIREASELTPALAEAGEAWERALLAINRAWFEVGP